MSTPVAADIRPMTDADLASVTTLLDAAVGAGFWDLGEDGSCRLVATAGGGVVGVGVGAIDEREFGELGLAAPVGVVRLVGVDGASRGHGIGTALVEAVCADCAERGATALLACAWVHGPTLEVPLAGVLERLGFRLVRRVPDFYAAFPTTVPCPACGQLPCLCSADLYVKAIRAAI